MMVDPPGIQEQANLEEVVDGVVPWVRLAGPHHMLDKL
jgi:hypothetical protein